MKESIRSFVRRSGRMTTAQSQALQSLWPQYGLEVKSGIDDWSYNAILEIGFGMGKSLLTMAMDSPVQKFIGIEVHPPGVGALLAGIDQRRINNVKVYKEDAVHVLNACIKKESLLKVQIFFPDPWPKSRHHKRRLIQKSFVELLAEKIKPGGFLHLATDWHHYAEQMLSVINEVNYFQNCAGQDNFLQNQTIRPSTKFEERGRRLGHQIWDLLFLKIN